MKKPSGIIFSAFIFLSLFLSGIFISGCSEDSVTTVTDNLDLSTYSTGNYTDLLDSLKLDTVKVLIKDIKLNVANSSDSTNFKVGPYVYFVNLNGSVNVMTTAYIPAGNYDKLIFKFHKLESSETPPDAEFKDSTGTYSVIVKGFYNGSYFIYKTDVSFHQKLNFPVSIGVETNTKTNITFRADPYKWFFKNGNFLNPTDPANKNDIDNNIKNNVNDNLRAYRDNDRNGIPD